MNIIEYHKNVNSVYSVKSADSMDINILCIFYGFNDYH